MRRSFSFAAMASMTSEPERRSTSTPCFRSARAASPRRFRDCDARGKTERSNGIHQSRDTGQTFGSQIRWLRNRQVFATSCLIERNWKGRSALYYEMPITRSELLAPVSRNGSKRHSFRSDFRYYQPLMYSVAGRVSTGQGESLGRLHLEAPLFSAGNDSHVYLDEVIGADSHVAVRTCESTTRHSQLTSPTRTALVLLRNLFQRRETCRNG